MAKLRSVDVLQIDATIIAGLLILLTIQSFSLDPIESKTQYQLNNDLLKQKNTEYAELGQVIKDLKIKQSNITNTDRIQYIQHQIDDNELKYEQTSVDIQFLSQKNTTLVNNGAMVLLPNATLVKILAITMIVPFAVSAGWELVATFGKDEREKEQATSGSKVWLIIGLFGLVLGLYFLDRLLLNG